MASRNFVNREQAIRINEEGKQMAVAVGEKFMVIPLEPEAYKNKQGRIVRANLRMHINNHISNPGLTPCELPGKTEAVTASVAANEILTPDQIDALDTLTGETDIDLSKEKVADVAKAIGVKISRAQIDLYLAR